MNRLKKLQGNGCLFTSFVLAMAALFVCVLILVNKWNCPCPCPPHIVSDSLPSYHITKDLAKEEVIRYQTFVNTTLASQLNGKDLKKIPLFFTVDNCDFLEAMGIDKVRRSSLSFAERYSRLYISMDVDSGLHLLFTPVVRAKIDICAPPDNAVLGKDTVRQGKIPSPCPSMIKRYGGQQKVNQIFSGKPFLTDADMLIDLNAPCPATCFTLSIRSDSSFINQQ